MPSQLEIELMRGLDDLAHNRLSTMNDDGSFTKVSNYGKCNLKEKCYCAELKRLGIKHG
jgi:hypothetical protein